MITDPWRHWQDNLDGKRVPLHEGTPNAGFYRTGSRGVRLGQGEAEYPYKKFIPPFTPVAYWPNEDDELNCRIGDDDVNPIVGQDLWISVCNHPVEEDDYRAKAEHNKPWHDEHELIPMGHNKPPEEGSYEDLRAKIEEAAQAAEDRTKGPPIADANERTKVETLHNELLALGKQAEDRRKAERKPHDDALKAVQAKWAPLVDRAEVYKNLKYKIITPWDIKQREEQKQAAEAAAAAGEPPPDIPKRRAVHGKTTSLRTFKSAKIIDYEACLKYFSDSPDIRATVQDLANKAIRAGIAIPGAELVEEQRTV